jgi:hypothetical protein
MIAEFLESGGETGFVLQIRNEQWFLALPCPAIGSFLGIDGKCVPRTDFPVRAPEIGSRAFAAIRADGELDELAIGQLAEEGCEFVEKAGEWRAPDDKVGNSEEDIGAGALDS